MIVTTMKTFLGVKKMRMGRFSLTINPMGESEKRADCSYSINRIGPITISDSKQQLLLRG